MPRLSIVTVHWDGSANGLCKGPMRIKHMLTAVACFVAGAFAGPTIYYSTEYWPKDWLDIPATAAILLWPGWFVGFFYQYFFSGLVAMALAFGANVLFFGIVGVIASVTCHRISIHIATYCVFMALNALFVIAVQGYSFLELLGILVVCIFYALLWWAPVRIAQV